MEKVTLLEMLSARERRVDTQKKMLDKNNCPVISFTLNIPGEIKNAPVYERAFMTGVKEIEKTLESKQMLVADRKLYMEKTGYELFLAIQDVSPEQVKRLMVKIEDKGKLGRLFDIDVLEVGGQKISRQQIGQKPRKCLLCGQEAHVCSRSRTHDTKELLNKIHQIITEELGEM